MFLKLVPWVTEDVTRWQDRLGDEVYAIVYLDAMRVKVCHNDLVINKAVYLALGVTGNGTENRGVEDIFIACVDGLKRFPKQSKRGSFLLRSKFA